MIFRRFICVIAWTKKKGKEKKGKEILNNCQRKFQCLINTLGWEGDQRDMRVHLGLVSSATNRKRKDNTTVPYYPNLICWTVNFFLNLFIYYFWLPLVFVAACGLSLVVASGSYSSLRCVGFSLQWLLLLQSMGSRRMGFSSCGTWAW